jgi:hypothetical protein
MIEGAIMSPVSFGAQEGRRSSLSVSVVNLMFPCTLFSWSWEPFHLMLSKGSNHEDVTHIVKRAERFMDCPVECNLLKFLHEDGGKPLAMLPVYL